MAAFQLHLVHLSQNWNVAGVYWKLESVNTILEKRDIGMSLVWDAEEFHRKLKN
jgi:hypothetical protein